jgi:hypothetical protein
VTFAEWLPWMLFGLLAGALVDRWERRRVMWAVDAGRLVPSLVSRDPGRLARANGRLAGTRMVAEELAGPPVGGLLFSLAA